VCNISNLIFYQALGTVLDSVIIKLNMYAFLLNFAKKKIENSFSLFKLVLVKVIFIIVK